MKTEWHISVPKGSFRRSFDERPTFITKNRIMCFPWNNTEFLVRIASYMEALFINFKKPLAFNSVWDSYWWRKIFSSVMESHVLLSSVKFLTQILASVWGKHLLDTYQHCRADVRLIIRGPKKTGRVVLTWELSVQVRKAMSIGKSADYEAPNWTLGARNQLCSKGKWCVRVVICELVSSKEREERQCG
jgi:hypothetical protein